MVASSSCGILRHVEPAFERRELDRYLQGDSVSDRQWRDVLGVLKVQAGRLDLSYLRAAAHGARLTEPLERALQEAGLAGD